MGSKQHTRYFVVGSVAAKFYGLDLGREPKDIDVIISADWDKPYNNFGLSRTEYFVNNELFEILRRYSSQTHAFHYLEPNLLYTLKLSHMSHDLKNKSWGKHMKDLLLMESKGWKVEPEMLKECYEFWDRYYQDKDHIKLNKTPKEFFTQEYNQQHDYLHSLFAFEDEPMFKKFLRDGSDVFPDKQKFMELSYQRKVKAVLEESKVIAYERKIPLIYGFKKLVTDLSKGWFNYWIIEHLIELYYRVKNETEWFRHEVNKVNEILSTTKKD